MEYNLIITPQTAEIHRYTSHVGLWCRHYYRTQPLTITPTQLSHLQLSQTALSVQILKDGLEIHVLKLNKK